MKRLVALILACLFLFCGCIAQPMTRTTEPAPADTETETGFDTPEFEPGYRLTARPDVQADEIRYYASADMEYECFVLCQGGRCGTMDKDGKVIVAPAYPDLELTWQVFDNNGESEDKGALFDMEDSLMVQSDGTMKSVNFLGIGFGNFADVYWMNGEGVLVAGYYMDMENPPCTYEEYYKYANALTFSYMNYAGATQPDVVPAREITALNKTGGGDESVTYKPELKSEKYGLYDFKTGKMVTGFLYDEVSAKPIAGVFAVRVGDKWGYVDVKGRQVAEIALDPARAYEGPAWSETRGDYTKMYYEMFQPVNGYIVTVKNGQYGMINVMGDTVMANRFEYVSQVGPGGVFWARENGVWYRGEMI